MATVPLSNVVDSLLQKAYHDLTVLQELLRHKSDGDRKAEIVKYARKTRSLLIRLLALVKWAGNSSSVQKCAEMSTMLSQQSGLYVDTANRLVELARNTLVHACLPNFSLAPAIDVLTTGTYPRLPTCIKDRVVPLPPLTESEGKNAVELLNCAIRHRLPAESIPESMHVTAIGEGVIKFKVPYEFEITLSVVSGDPTTPWRLVALRILVGDVLPDKSVLLHEHQRLFLHQVLQSRLYSEDTPLQDCYKALHSFCLALQLDCLNSQAQQLCSDVYGGYMKVEEYLPGHHLKIVYWRPGTSQFMSAFLLDQSRTSSWPKVLISIDPSQPQTSSFTTQHFPPLPEGSEVVLSPSNISLEALLKECVRVRSHTLLKELQAVLHGSCWESNVELVESPLCLRVKVPLKYTTKNVLLCVDPRVGNIVASIDPPSDVNGVQTCLEELEKTVTSNWSTLPAQLLKLQCHMFVSVVTETALEQGIKVHWSLPLISPLPFPAHTAKAIVAAVYLELLPLTHLLVDVGEGLQDHYHLVSLTPASLTPPLHLPHTPEAPPPPKSFYAVSSLVTLDVDTLVLQHLRTVVVNTRGAALKRKLMDSDMELPSLKRLCVCRKPDFAPLPSLISARMILLTMETSLMVAGISHSVHYSTHGCPSINIFSFPLLDESFRDAYKVLSSSLQSCTITHSSSSGYTCSMVLRAPQTSLPEDSVEERATKSDHVILRHPIAVGSCDLGQTLLCMWQARLTLFALTLELHSYLADSRWPLHSFCSISKFSYDLLTISFGKHSLTIKTTPTGLALSLSADCPHSLVRNSLEAFLHSTRSLPLLLQGVCASEEPLSLLLRFSERIPAMAVTATTPSQVQLTYDSFILSLSIQANSAVSITGIRLSKPPTTPMTPINPLTYLQAFLSSVLSDSSLESDETTEESTSQTNSNSTPQKTSIYTTPSPISFPRRISWPDSVPSPQGIPSIPQFPSPAVGAGLGQNDTSNITLTLDQLHQLFDVLPPRPVKPELCVAGCSLLESLLGSLSLLYHVTSKPYQLVFVQCDRGVYSYRTDNLIISFSMEGGVLKGALKPARDNVWSNGEVELLAELFKREVVTPPFTIAAFAAFLTLLILPITVFKSVVQLLQHHQSPPVGMVWSFSLCLTIPQGADLTGIPFSVGGPAIIYGRNKLLLFLKLERNQDKKTFILQIMYDPKSNLTYVARFQNQHRSHLHQQIDNQLRKASGDFASGHVPGHFSSSLYPAVLSLAQLSLPL